MNIIAKLKQITFKKFIYQRQFSLDEIFTFPKVLPFHNLTVRLTAKTKSW